MKFLYVTLFVVGGCFPAFAQEHFDCGHREAELKLLEKHPEVSVNRAKYAPILKKRQDQLSRSSRKDGVEYIIPVVFHIIHADGPENITNEQVFNAVECLNKDFAGARDDIGEVVPEFKDRIANTGIVFKLAQIDPEGNCTNGIVRYYDVNTSAGDENIKQGRIWPGENYLNIFVVRKIGSPPGAAGYSFYPGVGPDNEGIVLHYQYVGSIGTSEPIRSHVISHEVGHWLNLKHTWGDGACTDINNCESPFGDEVEDTPITTGNRKCNLSINTCGLGLPGDEIDNVQNFMEYAYCSRMFTNGQKDRMIATLIDYRSYLWTETNLSATGVLEPDHTLCKVDFVPSQNQEVATGSKVTFADLSNNKVISRNWSFPGGTPSTSTDSVVTVTYNTPGKYDVSLTVTGVNGTQTLLVPEKVKVYVTSSVFFEDFKKGFDGNNSKGFSWISYTENGPSYWEYRGANTTPDNTVGTQGSCSPDKGPIQSATSNDGFMIFDADWWENGDDTCGSRGGQAFYGQYGIFLGLEGSFDFSDNDFVQVSGSVKSISISAETVLEVSVDGGDTYTKVQDIMTPGLHLSGNTTRRFELPISQLAAHQPDVRIRFNWSGYYYYTQLDDLEIVTESDESGTTEKSPANVVLLRNEHLLTIQGANIDQLSVFDVSGRLLVRSNSNTIELPSASGMMLVRMETDRGVITRKVIN